MSRLGLSATRGIVLKRARRDLRHMCALGLSRLRQGLLVPFVDCHSLTAAG